MTLNDQSSPLNELRIHFYRLAADPMFIVDSDRFCIIDANQAACDHTGYSRDELANMSPKDLNAPSEHKELLKVRDKLKLDGIVRFETVHINRDGMRIPVEMHIRLVEHNGKTYSLAICRDLTDRKRMEDSIQHRERQLREAQSIAHIGSWDANLETGHVEWSEELYRIYGVSPESFTPSHDNFINLLHPDDRSAMRTWIADCIEGRNPKALQFRCVWPDGTIRYIEGQGALILDACGKPDHLSGTAQDITVRKKFEQSLNHAVLKLKQKEETQSRFLAAAGHDLRQPLAAANLFVGALRHTDLSRHQERIIHLLEETCSNFNELLDTLLDVSRLDAGVIKPEYTSINISELFNYLQQSFEPFFLEKNIRLRVYTPRNKLLSVRADIGLLKTVMRNLVSNALKFTTAGGVLISARQRGDMVLIQVWDTGIGIEKENIDKIFDEFCQIDNQQRDRTKGIGLGLAIAKRALSLFDGEIKCRSRVGIRSGSVFEFRLHADDSSTEPGNMEDFIISNNEGDQTVLIARGKRFIVVEDDGLVAEGLRQALLTMGGEVLCFKSAEDALNYDNIEDADYYIIDYMLAGSLNGIQFLDLLSQIQNKHVNNAVLITGDTSPAFVSAVENRDWPVLYKPINISNLLARLHNQDDCIV